MPGIAGSYESRLLVSMHRATEEINRFAALKPHTALLASLLRETVYSFYNHTQVLINKDLIIEKEPLEPVAFPDRRYEAFLKNTRTLVPGIKVLYMVRNPLSTIWSMSRRLWGYSLVDTEPHPFSLDDHIDNWCRCTELALSYIDDRDVHICIFENLVQDPVRESKAIFEFLGVSNEIPFEPRDTKQVGFDARQQDLILTKTQPLMEQLSVRLSRKAARSQGASPVTT
jgi:hypothetical protein